MHTYPFTDTQTDGFVLDQQIGKLKDEIKTLMATVDRLTADHHDTADATRHLGHLQQQYASLIQLRQRPNPQ